MTGVNILAVLQSTLQITTLVLDLLGALFRQTLVCRHSEQLPPNLKSFTALGYSFEDTDSVALFNNFINGRTIKTEAVIREHAESVGRKLGEDLVLGITYPWIEDKASQKDDQPFVSVEDFYIIRSTKYLRANTTQLESVHYIRILIPTSTISSVFMTLSSENAYLQSCLVTVQDHSPSMSSERGIDKFQRQLASMRATCEAICEHMWEFKSKVQSTVLLAF
ncbi:hypothetical protein BJ165DRAFT_1405932 [Panaeolus papilionaceus]|nr:hypothetical protein BJ165DRAFT_1405932 [Panaeolus papilionaceus]